MSFVSISFLFVSGSKTEARAGDTIAYAENKGKSTVVIIAAPTLIHRLVAEAVTTHPKTRAADERTQAARAGIRSIRLWEDPQLGLGYMAAERSMQQEDGDIIVSAEQALPRFGLYKAEKRKAVAEFRAQNASIQLNANELGLSVAQAAVELALADEVIRLQTENLSWLSTIVHTAEERAKNPDGTAAESLKLQSELAIRQQTLASAQRMRAQFARRLNILLGRGPLSTWQPLYLPAKMPQLPGISAVHDQLERTNPQLAALRHMTEGADAEIDMAKEKKKPVFSVGVESNTYSGASGMSVDQRSTVVTMKMSLPWLNNEAYRADVRKAEHLRRAAQSDLEAEARKLLTQSTELLTDAENNRRLVEAYSRDILPKTEQAVSTIADAWISSKATLLDVLDARRSYLDARQEQMRALAARHVSYYSFSATMGTLAVVKEKEKEGRP
ncbi:MAG: TolC family protein [Candidatus Methylacidiphilales bacterium]|nr:TolC family protein [Candidatus Methylacidiphilales bacterium]